MGDMRCSLAVSWDAPALLERRFEFVMTNSVLAVCTALSRAVCRPNSVGTMLSSRSFKFSEAIGRLDCRSRVGRSGERSGLGGILVSTFAILGGALALYGACEPRAEEREISWLGADEARGTLLRSAADVIKLFGSFAIISCYDVDQFEKAHILV